MDEEQSKTLLPATATLRPDGVGLQMKWILGTATWWKSRSNEEIPSWSFASVISNTFPRLFNLFIYESISNSFDYILFAPGVSIFAIKNGNTLLGERNALPRVLSCNIKRGLFFFCCNYSAPHSHSQSSIHYKLKIIIRAAQIQIRMCRHVTSNGNNMSGCAVLFMTAKTRKNF